MTAPRSTDVRRRILDTAFDLLAEQGVAHLTQPRVSRAAGVRQSHLTYYFPKRGDLLAALARHAMELLAAPMITQAQRGTLAPERLARLLADGLTDRRRIRAVLGLLAAAEEDPAVALAMRDFVGEVRGQLARTLEALHLPHDEGSVALLHTLLVGTAVLHHARGDEPARREAESMVRFATDVLSAGARAGGASAAAATTGPMPADSGRTER